ncbi:hypothetical protein WMY93_004753 [Mugilogobius chulae]|uniref:Uncharacterized protein n=1 Tax=Mugilogobius chulae TaxID=88201 RepID=A0AAW0PPD2_9GOBI
MADGSASSYAHRGSGEKRRRIPLFCWASSPQTQPSPSLSPGRHDYQRVSGEVLVSVNVMWRCFLWQVCLLLIRVHPSERPPRSRYKGGGHRQAMSPVHTLKTRSAVLWPTPRPAQPTTNHPLLALI